MLKQIFQTVTLPYFKRGDYWVNFFGADYHANVEPYIEKLNSVKGFFSYPAATLNSPSSIYVVTLNNVSWWPSWGIAFHRFDGTNGSYVLRMPLSSNIGAAFLGQVWKSRGGKLFWGDIFGQSATEFTLGDIATAPVYEDPENKDWWTFGGMTITDAHFGINGLGFSGDIAIDDISDRFLNGSGGTLGVYTLSSGEFLYAVDFPAGISALALEDENNVYILLDNRVLVLYDYVRKVVLGVAKLPTDTLTNPVKLTWDAIYRRLLFFDQTPDNADGSSTARAKGFRNVPQPTRLTKPIPLRVPRHGRVIPVMSQVVDDMNKGVGGYVVNSTVYGAGTLVGIPFTDGKGVSLTQVKCDTTLSGSPDSGEVTVDSYVTLDPEPEVPESGVAVIPDEDGGGDGSGGSSGGGSGGGSGSGDNAPGTGDSGGVASGASVTIDGINVIIEASPDVSSWSKTTSITSADTKLNISFSKKDGGGRWPDVTPPGWSGPIQYTIWIFMKISGQWYASGIVECWNGRIDPSDISIACGNQIARNFVYGSAWGPMQGHQPAVGEEMGIMVVAGDQRLKDVRSVLERSNIAFFKMPACGAGALSFTRTT